jgi:hypothetical protein
MRRGRRRSGIVQSIQRNSQPSTGQVAEFENGEKRIGEKKSNLDELQRFSCELGLSALVFERRSNAERSNAERRRASAAYLAKSIERRASAVIFSYGVHFNCDRTPSLIG